MFFQSKCCFSFFGIFCLCFSAGSCKDFKVLKMSIHYEYPHNWQCMSRDNFDLSVGEHLKVYVENQENQISHVRCQTFLGSNEYETIRWQKEGHGYILDPQFKISPTRLGVWNYKCIIFITPCAYFQENSCVYTYPETGSKLLIEGIKCITKIHVHKPKKEVSMYLSVNNEYFLSGKDNFYNFYDGEGANFVCERHVEGVVNLTHITRGGLNLTSSHPIDSPRIYMKLRNSNDGDILQCAYTDLSVSFLILLRLNVLKERQGIIAFAVNGLILPLNYQNDDNKYYKYYYYDGENLMVKVMKDKNMYEIVACRMSGTNIPETLKLNFWNELRETRFDTFTLNKINNNTQLSCTVRRKSDSKKFDIFVTFLFYTPDYRPYYINGLSMSNVELRYSTVLQQNTTNTIVYDIGTQKYEYQCSTKCSHCYYTTDFVPPEIYPRLFRLHRDHYIVTAVCQQFPISIGYKQTTYLILILKNETAINTTSTTPATILRTSPGLSVTNLTSVTVTVATSTAPPGISQGVVWYIVTGVLLLLVAIGLWTAFNYKKKRQLENNLYEEDRRNLAEDCQSTMAASSHWEQSDDNVYADPDAINNIYAQPTRKSKVSKVRPINDPKGSTNCPTTHQIDNEPTYASVQNEPTYASIQNEPTYANQNSTEYQNIDALKAGDDENNSNDLGSHQNKKENSPNNITYAVIYHKNNSANFNPPKMSVYSEIKLPKRNGNNEYVNGIEDNYIEPAYCEVIKPKK